MTAAARPVAVALREVTAPTVREVCKLAVSPDQQRFVAPSAMSIAHAYFEPAAWFRAVHADDTTRPSAFVMIDDPTRTATPDAGQLASLPR